MPEGPLPVPVATFVTKLWCILEKRDYHDVIRWSEVKKLWYHTFTTRRKCAGDRQCSTVLWFRGAGLQGKSSQ